MLRRARSCSKLQPRQDNRNNHRKSRLEEEAGNADFNFDGEVQLADLLAFLLAYDTQGPEWGNQPWIVNACEVAAFSDEELLSNITLCPTGDCCGNEGCAYEGALNYDPNADAEQYQNSNRNSN